MPQTLRAASVAAILRHQQPATHVKTAAFEAEEVGPRPHGFVLATVEPQQVRQEPPRPLFAVELGVVGR